MEKIKAEEKMKIKHRQALKLLWRNNRIHTAATNGPIDCKILDYVKRMITNCSSQQ